MREARIKEKLDNSEFISYYESQHVPLIIRLAGSPPVYKRNYVRPENALATSGPAVSFDVVTEQVFNTRADFEAWIAKLSNPEIAKLVREDEDRFLDRNHYLAYSVDERSSSPGKPASD